MLTWRNARKEKAHNEFQLTGIIKDDNKNIPPSTSEVKGKKQSTTCPLPKNSGTT